MSKALLVFLAIVIFQSTNGQKDWKQTIVLTYNSKEAEILYRYGDVDNLNQGWPPGFNPFSGLTTYSHRFPFFPSANDPIGTDRIMVTSGFKNTSSNTDGYTSQTKRPANNPVPLALKWNQKSIKIQKVVMQIYVDDFQPGIFAKNYQVTFDGERIPYLEYVINSLSQSGPQGKLLTIDILPQYLHFFDDGELNLFIDDPYTKNGDGFAIDFIQLLINPSTKATGIVKGELLNYKTGAPIEGGLLTASNGAQAYTAKDGKFTLPYITPGLAVINGMKSGFRAGYASIDISEKDSFSTVRIELRPYESEDAGAIQRILNEKGQIDLYGIQFDVNSDKIKIASENFLKELAEVLRKNPQFKLELSGHTDDDGNDDFNMELSLKRALAVIAWLKKNNAPVDNISSRGYGETRPIASNQTPEGKELNRRVEIKVTSN